MYLYYNVNTQKKPNTYILSIYNLNNDYNQLSKRFNSFIIEDLLFFNMVILYLHIYFPKLTRVKYTSNKLIITYLTIKMYYDETDFGCFVRFYGWQLQ